MDHTQSIIGTDIYISNIDIKFDKYLTSVPIIDNLCILDADTN